MRHCLHRFAKNTFVVLLAIGILDGFLQRDPYVRLAHGYAIAAICWSCPCELFHQKSEDDRVYSEWLALKLSPEAGSPPHFLLANSTQQLKFESEAEWRAAALEKHAQPGDIAARLGNVTRFNADDRHAIGQGQQGWFLLNLATHELLVTDSEQVWMAQVMNQTDLNPRRLRNPKSFLEQTRMPFVPWLYLALVCYALLHTAWECRAAKKETRKSLA